MAEYRLSYTASEIDEKLGKIDDIFEEVGRTYISNNLCDGVYKWGCFYEDGSESILNPENQGYITANFLSVEGGRSILWNADLTTNGGINSIYLMLEYDINKNFIKSSRSIAISVNKWDTGKAIALNENTRYIRFYIYNGTNEVDLNSILINIFYVENVEEFWTGAGDTFQYVPHIIIEPIGELIPFTKIESLLTGKKIVYDGDSICAGTHGGGGYAKLIADKVKGFYENQVIGGGRLRTQEGSSESFHSIVDNLINLPTDGDLYCFEGGINDYWTYGDLGSYDYENFTSDLDTTTVCGALETIFRYALNNFVGKPICFIITHKIQGTAYNANSNGNTFKSYHDAMVGICEKYSIPYYDAFNESGLNGWNTAQNMHILREIQRVLQMDVILMKKDTKDIMFHS